MSLDAVQIRRIVEAALAEDRADSDITTGSLVPPDQPGRAVIIARQQGVLAGLAVAGQTFAAVDAMVLWKGQKQDGWGLAPGDRVATLEGPLSSILRGERVALNFLAHLSGVATAVAAVVRAIEGTGCRLRDTRKTIPGLRDLQKYAVAVAGGVNHRRDLSDAVLIKDNHLAALRARGLGIADAVGLARAANPGARVEVEVTTIEEAREAMDADADELLLDNMSAGEIGNVVAIAAGRPRRPALEASGGITLKTAREIAGAGVDYISMGAVTHSAPALDLSLEVIG
jgi:nicotinate-nucleotide pyrophosphorylase (carboxylating)